MTEARTVPGPWEETDVALVVRALHRSGPTLLGDLPRDPALDGWPAQRLQHAIVSAWARNLIFFDTQDLLVAI